MELHRKLSWETMLKLKQKSGRILLQDVSETGCSCDAVANSVAGSDKEEDIKTNNNYARRRRFYD